MPPIFRSQLHSSIGITNEFGPTQQIISALDPLILSQDTNAPAGKEFVDGAKNLLVFADIVEIHGPLTLPGRRVKIFARIIRSSKDTKGQPAKIDVTPAAPAPAKERAPVVPKRSPAAAGAAGIAIMGGHSKEDKPGSDGDRGAKGNPGSPGAPGGKGGAIEIWCGKPAKDLSLLLIAKGGAGQGGQPGQPGQDGQDGGQGAEGTEGVLGVGLKYGSMGGRGGDGGDGGAGGTGGAGGEGGPIYINSLERFSDTMFKAEFGAGESGAPGGPGKGGARGTGGKSGLDFEALNEGGSFMDGFHRWQLPNGSDGNPGHTPDPVVSPKPGNPGWVVNHPGITASTLSSLALPSQCAMMMQRIRSSFLSADAEVNPGAFAETAELLAWVQTLTRPYAETPPKDPNGSLLAATYRQCVSLSQRLQLGLTVDGHPRSYAPRASLSFYQAALESSLKSLEELEKDSFGYYQAVEAQANAADKLGAANEKAAGIAKSLASKRSAIVTQLPTVEGVLKAAHNKVIAQEKLVTEKLQKFIKEIHDEEGLSVSAFASVITSLTLPKEKTKLSMVTFAAGAIWDVKGVFDKENETQYKVNRIGKIAEGLKPLAAAYKESEGALTLNDPNGYKLLASRKRIDEALKPYYGKLAADNVSDALDLLIDLSDQRNQLVLAYNALRGQLHEIDGQLAECAQQQASVATALQQKSRPDLAEHAAWVGDLYDKARNNMIEEVYLASRAYSWWALKDFPIYARLGLKSASTITSRILKTAREELLTDFRVAVEARGTAPSPFPTKEARKVNPASRGLVVVLNDQNFRRAFHELKDSPSHATTVSLPPTRPFTSMVPLRKPGESGNMEAFSLLAEVMVNKVRVYLRGAKSTGQKFAIGVVHGGVNEVVRRDGQEFTFTCVPVQLTFKYEETATGTTITFDGNITEETGKGAYAPLSPFGWWRIVVDPNANPGLDITGLTSVEMEFHGDAYSFPS